MTLTVDVISDIICPWCFIGKRRLEKAVGAHDEPVTAVRTVLGVGPGWKVLLIRGSSLFAVGSQRTHTPLSQLLRSAAQRRTRRRSGMTVSLSCAGSVAVPATHRASRPTAPGCARSVPALGDCRWQHASYPSRKQQSRQCSPRGRCPNK